MYHKKAIMSMLYTIYLQKHKLYKVLIPLALSLTPLDAICSVSIKHIALNQILFDKGCQQEYIPALSASCKSSGHLSSPREVLPKGLHTRLRPSERLESL